MTTKRPVHFSVQGSGDFPIQHDVRGEAAEALREAWEEQFNASTVGGACAVLLTRYLLDNFPQLAPWELNIGGHLKTVFALGTDDELATLGEVFGEAVSWEAWQAEASAAKQHAPDPFATEER